MGKRNWLIRKRQDHGLLQRDVAEKADISIKHYSALETGERRPSPQVAQRIAEVLDFPWTKFYE